MSDKSTVILTNATKIVDRNGRRVRYYKRIDASRPGQQIRRQKLAEGLKWCRVCQQWLLIKSVGKNGLCRPHENADARSRYATDLGFRTKRKARSYKRKRGVSPMPAIGAEMIAELFDNECAYCSEPFSTWDHVIPVSKGGTTAPGNMLPACRSCNSAKYNHDIEVWLDRAPMIKPYTIEYLSLMGML